MITVFLEPLFNKSKPKAKDIISAVVVIIGIYLLIPNVNLGDDITLGVLTGWYQRCFLLFVILPINATLASMVDRKPCFIKR